MPDFSDGYQNDKAAGGNGFGSSGLGGPGGGDGGGERWGGRNRETLAKHKYNLADPGLYGDLRNMRAQAARQFARKKAERDYQARLASQQWTHDYIAQTPDMPWADRSKANMALYSGDLATLDQMGVPTDHMRSTHHAGGLLGGLGSALGFNSNDVLTTQEVKDKYGTSDNQGSEFAGMTAKNLGPGIAQGLYAVTGAPLAGLAGGLGADAVGAKYGPSAPGALTAGAKLAQFAGAGSPLTAPAMGFYGLTNSAINRQYGGLLSDPNRAVSTEDSENGRGYLWPSRIQA